MAGFTKKSKTNRVANFMEELAGDILTGLPEYKSGRFTPEATEDIKALALNRLWPMYTTTTTGRDFLRKMVIEDKVENDVVRELRLAIDKVSSHPR